jgi:hypothetical protein
MTPQDQPPAHAPECRKSDPEIDYGMFLPCTCGASQPPPDPPAPTLRALIEKWRETAGYTTSLGEFEALHECADDLEALLTETDGPAPQKEQP